MPNMYRVSDKRFWFYKLILSQILLISFRKQRLGDISFANFAKNSEFGIISLMRRFVSFKSQRKQRHLAETMHWFTIAHFQII